MHYVVPGMRLIPQDKEMSCWYACAMMLVHWRRNHLQMTEAVHPDPSQVARWQGLYRANPGITNEQLVALARDLGLELIPPMSPSPQLIHSWLVQYGPLWVNGVAHITVIAGIRESEVLVFDPARSTKIHGEWRSLAGWYVQDRHSGRDVSGAVQAVFLRLRSSTYE